MKNFVMIAGLTFSLLSTNQVMAQVVPHTDSANDAYFDVVQINTVLKSVEENIVSMNEVMPPESNESTLTLPLFFQQGVDPMAIAELLVKVWDIIKEGAPVVNVQYKNANALPNLANYKWEALTGWKPERTLTFGVSFGNAYGMTTVDLEYKVKLIYGGRANGKGFYIASARVVPTLVDVKWGYNLDVTVEVPSVINLASSEDPMAAINLDVTYKVSTILRSFSESNSYELHGNGFMKADNKVAFIANPSCR